MSWTEAGTSDRVERGINEPAHPQDYSSEYRPLVGNGVIEKCQEAHNRDGDDENRICDGVPP